MALTGISEVYSQADALLERLLCISVARTQIYRVTDALGVALEDKQTEVHPVVPLAKNEWVYASMDGSMIQTEQGWKEVKLGRVFRTGSVESDGTVNPSMRDNRYSAHLGSYPDFLPRFEASLGAWNQHPEQLVFITDGAEWIHHYLKDRYPNATHILDYFHAVEKLTAFAHSLFPDESLRHAWLKAQSDLIEAGQVAQVMERLDQLIPLTPTTRKLRDSLKSYYWRNQERMAYDLYRSRGLRIGSGPMESAHRTVLQVRMKRSGQHWSTQGAKNMINLRVAYNNDQWQWAMQPLRLAA